jgi:hypothetical protein
MTELIVCGLLAFALMAWAKGKLDEGERHCRRMAKLQELTGEAPTKENI